MFKMQHYYTGEYTSYQDLILSRIPDINIMDYVYPDHDYDIAPTNYHEMKRGAELFLEYAGDNNKKIAILVDVDVDGYTSSAMLIQFLKSLGHTNIEVIHHDRKMHGLYDNSIEKIQEAEPQLLLLPDSSSDDYEELLYLAKFMDIIIIDHHDISDDRIYDIDYLGIVLINNQSKLNTKKVNKHLTGAGMVLRFIEMCKEILDIPFTYEYYDLAMLGLLGDLADTSDYEIRNIVFKGLENISNPLILECLKGKDISIHNATPMDIEFSINPLINATTRVATMEEKEFIFKTLSETNLHNKYIREERRRKIKGVFQKVEIDFTYYEYAFDLMTRVKGRQDRLVEKLEKNLLDNVSDDGGIAVGLIEEEYQGITGLVANKLASRLRKPVLLLRAKEFTDEYFGSARGYVRSLDDFKTWCTETELFEFAQGHDNAFGVSIREANIDKLVERTKEIETLEKIYNIDISFDNDNILCYNDISELNETHSLTGGSVDRVSVGLHNYSISKDDIKAYKSVTKIILDKNLELIIFNDNNEVANKLKDYPFDFINIDVVGRPQLNSWFRGTTAQIVVDDIQISDGTALMNPRPTKIDTIQF